MTGDATEKSKNQKLQEALRSLVDDIDGLAAESEGVAGLHLNGDIASWGELLDEGHMSAWLGDSLAKARELLPRETESQKE